MKTHVVVTIAVAITAAISGAVISTTGHAGPNDPKLPSIVTPTDASVKEKLTDATFMEKAVQSNLESAAISKIALEKSSNPKLKKFAQKIVDNSAQTMTRLRTVATENRMTVPTQLSGDPKSMINQMQQLNGADFDQAYADVIQKMQDSTVALYDNASGEGTLNVNLRVFANKELPELRKNQKLAHALKPTTPEAASNTKTKAK